MVIEGNIANVDAAADLGKMVTFCAKHNLGGMEGLIGVPGTVGGALRMNAGAYGTQIGSHVREVKVYQAAARKIETLKGDQISFEYRHTSFAPDDMMLAVKLELPSKPYSEILQGIRLCNEKRRASQPLGQKSAGCIFKNPMGASAGRMIDELGLKGHSKGDARVSDRHANFFVNSGRASAADMLGLIADVRRAGTKGLRSNSRKRGGGLERVKPLQRNASAAAAAEHEPYRPELVAEDEPRYLRRQKPVEIRRKKFSGKTGSYYRRVFVWTLVGVAVVGASAFSARYLLYSPQMLLVKPDQIEVNGNHIVAPEDVQKLFVRDRNLSVLRIPLDARRTQIEELSWVEEASVQRILPNRIRVLITERTPIAFFRNGTELTLIDAHGVLLDRPEGEDFHFPIVTGLSENLPREEREKRMQTYQEFMKDADLVKPGSSDRISELDLSNPRDLRVVLTGLAGTTDDHAVTVHFGQNDFTGKYRMLVENFAQWQANSGVVHSIDLQYSRQVVVNPDTSTTVAKRK